MANTRPLSRPGTEPGYPPAILAIFDAIGGNRAMAMAFSGWSYSTDKQTCATFDVAPALRRQVLDRITHVRVTLEPADTYRVELLHVSLSLWPAGREVASLRGLHVNDVRSFIESRTGLRLSLGTLGAGRG